MSGAPLTREPDPPAAFRRGELRWLAATGLAVLTGLAMAVPDRHQGFPSRGSERLLLELAGCGVVLFLRRWPLPVQAVTAAGTAAAIAASGGPVPLGAVLGVATYFVASQVPRRRSIVASAGALACLGVGLRYASLAVRHAPVAVDAVEAILPLVAAWFVGDSVAARRRYLAGLAEQAERARLAEAERAHQEVREQRVRIARELHDVVAHTLAVITVQAGVGRRLMERQPEAAAGALESIEAVGRTAQDELRVVLGLLRDEGVPIATLAPAPKLADLASLVETVRASGTPVDLRMPDTDGELSPALQLSIYRVVQEALTNVVKHAPGALARVELTVSPGDIRVEVTDDGRTSPAPAGARVAGAEAVGWPGAGHGIAGMRERISAFGGSLEAAPTAGHGYRVLASVPLEGAM